MSTTIPPPVKGHGAAGRQLAKERGRSVAWACVAAATLNLGKARDIGTVGSAEQTLLTSCPRTPRLIVQQLKYFEYPSSMFTNCYLYFFIINPDIYSSYLLGILGVGDNGKVCHLGTHIMRAQGLRANPSSQVRVGTSTLGPWTRTESLQLTLQNKF